MWPRHSVPGAKPKRLPVVCLGEHDVYGVADRLRGDHKSGMGRRSFGQQRRHSPNLVANSTPLAHSVCWASVAWCLSLRRTFRARRWCKSDRRASEQPSFPILSDRFRFAP